MNRNAVSAALVLVMTLLVLGLAGCQPAAPDTNRNATAMASPSPAKEEFDAAAIEAELIRLEREWAAAAKNKDADAVRRVVADNAVLVYPDGSTGTKDDEVRLVETGAITADSWEFLDPKVTVVSADTAFITGRSILKKAKLKDPKTNEVFDISGEYRFLDVYNRRAGKWQAVASQTTRIANPAPPAPSPRPAASPSPSAKASS